MYRDRYDSAMCGLLNDSETYKKLNNDPTITFEGKTNKLIKNLHERKYIDIFTYKKLIRHNSIPPKIYGIPKIHKADHPLRPIVSNTESHTTYLSEYLSSILKSAFQPYCQYKIKDSFQFSQLIQDTVLSDDDVLVSFDVSSLFTNIPTDLVIRIIIENWDLVENITPIPKQEFIKALQWVFDSVYFSYSDQFYLQVSGIPMGSSISPIIAEIIMNNILKFVVSSVPHTFKFIYNYVDDIICACPSEQLEQIYSLFNSYHTKLRFTYEIEKEGTIPFLDTLIVKQNNKLKLRWYRKTSNSNRFLNYNSVCPKKYKINLIKALKYRVTHISHKDYLQQDLQLLSSILTDNNYPKHLINKLLFSTPLVLNSNTLNESTQTAVSVANSDKREKYKSLPYVQNLTNKIKRIFINLPINIAYYSAFSLSRFFTNLKDKTKCLQQTQVVYKLQCKDCQISYLGNTKQRLKNRITQHKSDSKLKNKQNSCGLASHISNNKHEIDTENATVIFREKNLQKRLFLETLAINLIEPNCNNKRDGQNFSNIYKGLLPFIKIKT